MRRCVPLCLALLVLGCKSPEEKACENTVRIHGVHAAQTGVADGKTPDQRQRGCLDSLRRLREQVEPDEEQWFTYLRCMREAQAMPDQAACLEPLLGPAAGGGAVEAGTANAPAGASPR